MKPEVAKFTKERPVKKPDLWRCFRNARSTAFVKVQVDKAFSVIGKNAPRYMEGRGYLVRENTDNGDFFALTEEGERWLTAGIVAYIKNHPAEKRTLRGWPGETATQRILRGR